MKMDKRKSFTLVEVMVVSFILLALFTGIFATLNVGESLTPLNLAGVDAAAQARIIMTRITNDLRGAVVWDIRDHTPSSSYIKFRRLQDEVDLEVKDDYYVFGYNCEQVEDEEICLFDYVEYSFDKEAETLTRSVTTIKGSDPPEEVKKVEVEFQNVVGEGVFYTTEEEPLEPENSLDINKGFVIINIEIEKPSRANNTIRSSLNQRVKIRNE